VNWFKRRQVTVPQSYQPVLEAQEVVDLFGRLTLHHQAALLRLMSRNFVIQIEDEPHMGYEFNFDVEGALIVAQKEDD
tara:strand:- start:243 stop:476 length:234 start_codon:yes stop_codon:yes gene_type:complete